MSDDTPPSHLKWPSHSVSSYAPTLTSTTKAKDEFYTNLSNIMKNIPPKENLIIFGDFNAGVGADHDSCSSCLRHFGVGKINDNRQHLLEFCSYHGLCMTNSYFQIKPQHKVSWCHPRSKQLAPTGHDLDPSYPPQVHAPLTPTTGQTVTPTTL